jgi:MinD-like ATPase involved in chromosome partitioning or flagellar assembly
VIPNEYGETAAAREPEQHADGTAGAGPERLDEGQHDDYLTSGANPFSSVHPQGTGLFPRLLPREFPDDEAPPDMPVMEQLPDPNAMPGYAVMGGYEQAFPPVAPEFPPVASAFPPPPEPDPAPSAFPGASYQYSADPYLAPRSPEAAPPLHGAAMQEPDGRAAARPWQAPPLISPASGNQPASLPSSAPAVHAAVPDAPAPAAPDGATVPSAGGSHRKAVPAAEPPRRETADSLTTDQLLHGKRPLPGTGWRRTVYRASGGLIRVGESAADMRRRELVDRVRTPVAGGHHRVAVMSLKGGVGKTTAAVGLGSTLASLRGDRVIAVDGNPDRGTLSDKVRLETSATIRDLLNERAMVTRYADVRAFTSQASSRLEILASDRDPGVSVAFSADDYRAVARVLEHYYSICITDCGTGLLHSAMAGILELADHIVLVSSPSVDGARSASATLDWLEAHDYGDLVRDGVVVLSTIRPRSKSTIDLDRLEQHFAARCRAVVRIPYDPHLEEGAEVELDLLNPETADAYLALAAHVGDGFAVPRRPVSRMTPATRFA